VARGLDWQRGVMLILGTFTGAWFLYVGIALTSSGPQTVLFAIAGVGMLVIAWTRAIGPPFMAFPEERMRPMTTQGRLVARLLTVSLVFGGVASAVFLILGVGSTTVYLVLTIGFALWFSSTVILWRVRRDSRLVDRVEPASTPP
jgi:hypothetical protein